MWGIGANRADQHDLCVFPDGDNPPVCLQQHAVEARYDSWGTVDKLLAGCGQTGRQEVLKACTEPTVENSRQLFNGRIGTEVRSSAFVAARMRE